MRNIILLVFLIAPLTLLADEQVYDVSVAIDGRTDEVVIDDAKKKVIWKAAINYPALISGVESVDDRGRFSSELTALTAAAINVKTKSLKWDRGDNRLFYSGVASVDSSMSIELIQGVKSNLELQQSLRTAYSALNAAVKADVVQSAAFEQAVEDVSTVKVVHFKRDTYEETLKAKSLLRRHHESFVLRNVVKPFLNTLTYSLADIREGAITYNANINETADVISKGFNDSCGLLSAVHSQYIVIVTESCRFHPLYKGTPFEKDGGLPFRLKFRVEGADSVDVLGRHSAGGLRVTIYGDEKVLNQFIANPDRIKEHVVISLMNNKKLH